MSTLLYLHWHKGPIGRARARSASPFLPCCLCICSAVDCSLLLAGLLQRSDLRHAGAASGANCLLDYILRHPRLLSLLVMMQSVGAGAQLCSTAMVSCNQASHNQQTRHTPRD